MPDSGQSDYEHGQCHILAIALHEASGLPLMAALVEDGGRTCLVHAWVRRPDGLALHVRGAEPVKYMLAHFPDGDEAWVKPITVEALLRLGEGTRAKTALVQKRIDAARWTARLLLDGEAEVARRVAALHVSACSGAEVALQKAALADEIEGMFRELSPGMDAMVAMLRWAAPIHTQAEQAKHG